MSVLTACCVDDLGLVTIRIVPLCRPKFPEVSVCKVTFAAGGALYARCFWGLSAPGSRFLLSHSRRHGRAEICGRLRTIIVQFQSKIIILLCLELFAWSHDVQSDNFGWHTGS